MAGTRRPVEPDHGRPWVSALDVAVLEVLPLTEERRGTTLRDTKSVAERLASTAVALFARSGFDDITVQDIAAQAGVTARTFFRYFPSKETIILDIHDQTNLRLMTLIETAAPGTGVLETVCEACVQWCQEYEDLLTAIGQLTAGSTTLTAAVLLRATTWEQRLIQALERRFPEVGTSDSEVWGMTMMAMLRLVANKAHSSTVSYTECARVVFSSLEALAGAQAAEPRVLRSAAKPRRRPAVVRDHPSGRSQLLEAP